MSEHTEAERTAIAELLLIEILSKLDLEPEFGVAGLGAAEARVTLRDGTVARLNVGIDETHAERLSVLEAAMAHRACQLPER